MKMMAGNVKLIPPTYKFAFPLKRTMPWNLLSSDGMVPVSVLDDKSNISDVSEPVYSYSQV